MLIESEADIEIYRKVPGFQGGISREGWIPEVSWGRSRLLPASGSSNEPFGFETTRPLGEGPDPAPMPACPSSQTPIYVRSQSWAPEDSLAPHLASSSSLPHPRSDLLPCSSYDVVFASPPLNSNPIHNCI